MGTTMGTTMGGGGGRSSSVTTLPPVPGAQPRTGPSAGPAGGRSHSDSYNAGPEQQLGDELEQQLATTDPARARKLETLRRKFRITEKKKTGGH